MATKIKTPETKVKRKPRVAPTVANVINATAKAIPKTPRPRKTKVDPDVEDAAYAKIRQPEAGPTASTPSKPRLGHFVKLGKDLVSGDAAAIATATAIVVGAALIEVELIPGLVIGAGAMLLSKVFPEIGSYARPAMKGAIRSGFFIVQKAREVIAETTEQMQDLVAEVALERVEPQPTQKTAPVQAPMYAKPQA